MTNQSQQSSGGPNCLTVMAVLTLVMLVVMLALGITAWNAIGGFFGGIGTGISALGEDLEGAVGQSLKDLGETVDGIGEGVKELGDSVSSLPQAVADAVTEALFTLSQNLENAVKEAIKDETRASIDTKNLLAHSLIHMGTLVTASQQVDADVSIGIRSGLLNLCGASVDHVVEGTIEAGVDLSQVQASDITHDILSDSWVLQLGAGTMHSCRIDYIRQIGHSRSVCRQDWDSYRLLAETAVLPQLRNEALAEGLLAKAEQQAELVLGNFLSAVTGSPNVTVVFESEPETIFPESCLREPPSGWKFDEESDSWVQE